MQPVQYGSLTSESQVRAGKPMNASATGKRLDGSGYCAVTRAAQGRLGGDQEALEKPDHEISASPADEPGEAGTGDRASRAECSVTVIRDGRLPGRAAIR